MAPGWQAVLTTQAWARSGLEVTLGLTTATRFPSLFERHGDGLFVAPALDLEDERGTVASLTARWEVLGLPRAWRIALVGSAFASRLDDVIQLRRNNLFTAVAENVGRATVRGGELSVESDLWRHLRVRLAATALDTQMSSEELAIDGKPLPLRPDASLYGRATVYEAWPAGDELAAFVELDYRGPHTYDMAGLARAPVATEIGAGVRSALSLGGLLGPSARLGVEARLMNAADAHSVDLLGYPRPGRRWAVQLTWREEAL
jgi:outer membrane cobalamin receptor